MPNDNITNLEIDETEREEIENYGYCRFCGQFGNIPKELEEYSQDEKNQYITDNCDCYQGEDYRQNKLREQAKEEKMLEYQSKTNDFIKKVAETGEYCTQESVNRAKELLQIIGERVYDGDIDAATLNISSCYKVKIYMTAKGKLCFLETKTTQQKLEL